MRLSHSTKTRFAIAVGVSIGIGHTVLQAFTRNLGPIVGLLTGIGATAAVALAVAALLQWSIGNEARR